MRMKRAGQCFMVLVFCAVNGFPQESAIPKTDPYKPTLERLASLTREWVPEWRVHPDIARPEAASVDDSTWPVLRVGDPADPRIKNDLWSGPRVFRRTITIPKTINGYSTEGSR